MRRESQCRPGIKYKCDAQAGEGEGEGESPGSRVRAWERELKKGAQHPLTLV